MPARSHVWQRRRPARLPLIGLIAVSMTATLPGVGVGPSIAAAQSASPTSGTMIAAVECTVDPISDEQMALFAATPSDGGVSTPTAAGSPAATPMDTFVMPSGDPASDDEVAAVSETVTQLVACLNAGDYRRVNALYTDAYLARNLSVSSAEAAVATPNPSTAATQVTLIEIQEVIRLADGRLGATVVLGSEATPRQTVQYSVFADQDGEWLIDEETVIEARNEATPAASPAA